MSRRWATAALAATGALAVAAASGSDAGRRIDERLFELVNRGHGPAADAFFAGVTEFGSIMASVGGAVVLAVGGRRKAALSALGAASAMWVVGQAAKRRYMRPRPYQSPNGSRLLIDRPGGTSWPSSHPAVLLAFVTVAARELRLPKEARAALGGLAGVVALSRVYVGVHYPSDVAGGLLIGLAVADLWPTAHSRPSATVGV